MKKLILHHLQEVKNCSNKAIASFEILSTMFSFSKSIFSWSVFFLLLFAGENAFGQAQAIGSFTAMDGGFEGQSTVNNVSSTVVASGTQLTTYTTATALNSTALTTSVVRTGGKALSWATSSTSNLLFTPTASSTAIGNLTSYVVQFYYQKSASVSSRAFKIAISVDGSTKLGAQVVTSSLSSTSWTKVTAVVTSGSSTATPRYGIVQFQPSGGSFTSPGYYLDDICVYAGSSADVTAPDVATSPGATVVSGTSLNVSWTAPASGVDGGGYVLVRSTSASAPTPNANGLYGVGNTMGASYSVVYEGNNTSFTDTGLSSGTTYYYYIFTVDKAFNYSSAATCSATPSAGTAPTVTTGTVAVTSSGATVSNNAITSLGSDNVTVSGVAWSTTSGEETATSGSNYTSDGGAFSSTGSFGSTISSLAANTTYYVKAYATNSAGTSYGSEVSFSTLPGVPTATAGTSTCSSITANWSAPAGGSAYTLTYTLEYGTDSTFVTFTDITDIASTSQTVTALNTGTTYYYRVKAVTSAGSSDWSNKIAVATIAAPAITTQPVNGNYTEGATPTDLSVIATGDGLTYQWYSNSTQSTSGASALSGQTGDTYTPSTSTIGTVWYFCVVSGTCTPNDTSDIVSVEVSAATNPVIALTSGHPEQTVAAGTAIDNIVYTWGGSATGAVIAWSGASTTTPTGISVDDNSGNGPVTISGTPTVAGIYNYAIRSFFATDTSSALTGILTVKLATPAANAASVITGTGFTASWGAVSNASSYTVNVYQGASLITSQSGVTETSVAITGLSAGTAYTYTVTAVGAVNSDESSAVNFTTLSSACDITAFDITNEISSTINGTSISVVMPYGTNVTNLTPTITLSTGSTVSPVSGSVQNYTNAVVYTVTAEDGITTKQYTVTVTVSGGSSEKDITAFTFTNATPVSTTINSTSAPYSVTIVMPSGTERYGLIPSITVSDYATISPLSGVNQDFRTPVNYTVTAQDGTTKVYAVTVTNEATTCSYDLFVPNATYVTGGTPAYYYEVAGVGYLMKNATGSSTWSTTTISSCEGTTTALPTGSSLFAFKTYNAISSFTVYGVGTSGGRTLSNVEVGTTTSNYSLISATASGGDGKFTTSGVCDSMIITPGNVIDANSYVMVTFSGNVDIVKLTFNGTCAGVTPLSSPVIGAPSSATNQGFTANWTDGSNEIGYKVVVYNAAGDSVTSVTTAANVTSADITGLSANTSYYYKVRAIGDGDVYSNSPLSVASATIRTLSSDKDITSFIVAGVTATISGTDISATVLYSTDVTNLAPTIAVSDYASVSPTSGTAQDFTNPVNYTVTAEDGSTQVYTVTITKAPVSTACDITEFSIADQISSTITGSAISVVMPYGTDLTSITPTVTTSDGATYSPTSAQNFTSSVVYTVTAEDGTTTQQYTVTVTTATPSISVCTSSMSFTSLGYTPTASQSCVITGTNLAADISVSVDDPFQVSTDNSTWSNTATIVKSGSTVNSGIYVRYNPTSGTSHSGVANFTSTGASTQSFSLSGVLVSAATDYYRSVTTGNWSVAANWESSPDSINWVAATQAPTSTAKRVMVVSGDTITISAETTLGNTNIMAGGYLISSAIYTVNSSDTLTIDQDGTLEYTASANASASNSPVINGYAVVKGNYVVNPANPDNLNTTTPSDKAYYLPYNNTTYQSTCVVTIKRLPSTGDNLRITKDIVGTLVFDVQSLSDNAGSAGYDFLSYTPATIGTLIIKGTGAGSISQGTGSTFRTMTVLDSMTVSGGAYAVAGGTSTGTSSLIINGNLAISGGTLTASNSSGDNSSSLTILGNVDITGGTFTSYTGTGTGAHLSFAGAINQTLSANGTYTIGSFDINNSNGVTLNSNLTISGILTLTSGNLIMGDYNLVLNSAIAGTPSVSNHIVTNGAGVVEYTTTSGAYTFPVGADNLSYTPVTITNTGGVSQTYTVNVDSIGTPSLSNAFNYKWNIGGINGSASTLAFTWNSASANGTLATDATNAIAYNYSAGWTAVGGTSSDYVTTISGVSSSNPLAWTVCHKTPSITTQPIDSLQECVGGIDSLSVASDQVVTYQWYSNTTKSNVGGTAVVTGGSAATYTPDASAAGVYYYYCVITNGTASATSDAVVFTVDEAPVITGTDTISLGSTTTLSANIAGGTWMSGTPSVATIDASTGLVDGIKTGYSIITYTTATGCTATKTIWVVDSVYKSVASAPWSQVSTWNVSLDGGKTWTAATEVPSSTIRKVYISAGDALTISSAENVTVQTLYIASTGRLYNEGTFVANDSIIFAADNSSTAQFKNDGTVTNNGVVKLLKYFTAGVWYNVAFPFDVAHGQVTDIVGNVLTPQSDFYVEKYDGDHRAYYNASNSTNGLNWVVVNPESLTANKGYIMGRSKSVNSYGVTLYNLSISSLTGSGANDMFTNTSKDVSVDLNNYSGTTTVSNQGWNLVANPYSTAYNLRYLSPAVICYIYNPLNNSYQTVSDEDYYLDPFKSFFFQTANTTITFTGGTSTLKNASIPSYDEVKLSFSNGNDSDNVRVRLGDNATTGYDLNVDGVKFLSTKVPQIYSSMNGYSLSINSLPETLGATTTVPISYYASAAGSYTFRYTPTTSSDNFKELYLSDNGTLIDLLATPTYTANLAAGSNTTRFALLIETNNTVTDAKTNAKDKITISVVNNKITFYGLDTKANVFLYDVAGKLVKNYGYVNNIEPLLVNGSGVYIIKAITDTQTFAKKIVVR